MFLRRSLTRKTSSALIEHMRQHCATKPGSILLYFYFSFSDAMRQTTFACLSSLLRQLCNHGDVFSQVKKMYANSKRMRAGPPRYDDIRSCLESATTAMKGSNRLYIILDALDELPNDPDGLQRKRILSWVTELSAQESHFHICFASRASSSSLDIKNAMDVHPRVFEVTLDAEKNRDDIHSYLVNQFHAHNNLIHLTKLNGIDIMDTILQRADGM